MKEALARDGQNARNTFYLAQSFKDVGDCRSAMEWYEKRVLMGGWEEEVYYSLHQLGRMSELLKND